MSLFEQILAARGLDGPQAALFLHPDYAGLHDPFLLPDMQLAVERLAAAQAAQEPITIYGDYDIDGLTATTVLIDAFESFGFTHVDTFMPNRFVEGYGLTVDAVEQIAQRGTKLIVTVDCGSLSHEPIARARELGMDVIVTDHHNVADTQPDAVAVINPKRVLHDHPSEFDAQYRLKPGSKLHGKVYPFLDISGVGVAFKLVQALQTTLEGLPAGHEKWLLDLVALGTVCDVVNLVGENRVFVYYGLQVLAKTRRPGLQALMSVARVEPRSLNARSLGFALGPRMNAAGRLETAQHSLDMLLAAEPATALAGAQLLDSMNVARRGEQAEILKAALVQAEQYADNPVLVVSAPEWNHGIVGIVAAGLLERFQKPAFVLQEMGEEAKGSARSYGDFSAADAIRAAEDLITKGGGHKLAAGVTLPTASIAAFRARVNDLYHSLKLKDQAMLLLPREDVTIEHFGDINEALIEAIAALEPFGQGNPQPIIKATNVVVTATREMGDRGQHVKLTLEDADGRSLQMIAFGAPEHFFVEPGARVSVWFEPNLNEWQGGRSVEGRLLHLELA